MASTPFKMAGQRCARHLLRLRFGPARAAALQAAAAMMELAAAVELSLAPDAGQPGWSGVSVSSAP